MGNSCINVASIGTAKKEKVSGHDNANIGDDSSA